MSEVLFILDEAASVLNGSMPAIEQGLVIGRSYDIRMAFFFQSFVQLKQTFKNKESVVLDNTEQIVFGVRGIETGEWVSKMLGERTIAVEGAESGTSLSQKENGAGVSVSRSSGRNWSVIARALLKPDEVLQLDSSYLIAFLRDVRPILAVRIRWYQDPLFVGRSAPRKQLLWWVLMAGAVGLILWSTMGR